jgi:small subunit ribosomal protein S4
MQENKCKICRRLGTKLFLKGDRCFSQKCALLRKSYPPGQKSKKRRRNISEYGKELQEKQKLRRWYQLKEGQFRKYVLSALAKRGQVEDAGTFLIQKLEKRLDNVIFRMGITPSRHRARQIVGHGHVLVNGRKIDTPSYEVKNGDLVSLKPASLEKDGFKDIASLLKRYQAPSWINLDKEKIEAKIIGDPSMEDVVPPAEVSAIFEFYSR